MTIRRQEEEEYKECKAGEHLWTPAIYCKNCGEYYEGWERNIESRTAFALVVEDLKKVLDEMWKEKRINRNNSIELYNRMMKRAFQDRGFIKHVK